MVAIAHSVPEVASKLTRRGEAQFRRKLFVCIFNGLLLVALSSTGARASGQLAELEGRLGEIIRHERIDIPIVVAGWTFYLYNPGSAVRDRLVVKHGWLDAPRTLVDPALLGGGRGIGGFAPAPNGALVAATLTQPGRLVREIGIWRTEDGGRLDDRLSCVVGDELVWSTDGNGFFYSASYSAEVGLQLFYHRVGSPQKEDVLIFRGTEKAPLDHIRAELTSDGRELLVEHSVPGDLGNAVTHIPLGAGPSPIFGRPPRSLVPPTGNRYEFIGNYGDVLLFFTDENAPRGRVVELNIRTPDLRRSVIHEAVDWNGMIEEVRFFAGRIVVRVLDNVTNRLFVYDFTGRPLGEISLPESLPVRKIGGRRDMPEFWILAESLVHPGVLYRHDLQRERTVRIHERKSPLDTEIVRTRRYSYQTETGPAMLLFVTHLKKTVVGPQAPWWLFGANGFGQVAHRSFSPLAVLWLERGGVIAHANHRGGGEFGAGFHRAGVGELRRNSFGDCVAAVRFLTNQRMAEPAHLVVSGVGAGATTVAGAVALRPDLAAAVILDGGFYRFGGGFALGASVDWVVEFGVAPPEIPDFLIPSLTARAPSVLVGYSQTDELVSEAEVSAFVEQLTKSRGALASPVAIEATAAAGVGIGRGEAILDDRIRWLALQANHALSVAPAARKDAASVKR